MEQSVLFQQVQKLQLILVMTSLVGSQQMEQKLKKQQKLQLLDHKPSLLTIKQAMVLHTQLFMKFKTLMTTKLSDQVTQNLIDKHYIQQLEPKLTQLTFQNILQMVHSFRQLFLEEHL